MERISIQIDSPGYVKVSEISEELLKFSSIIETKLLLSGKSFTRQKIRQKPSCRIPASFVTLLVTKKL